MRNSRIPFVKYLIELLIVAFGVFLGIMISTYQNNNRTEKNIKKSIGFIHRELKSNSQKLDKAIAYHYKLKSSFDSIKKELPSDLAMENYYTQQAFRHNKVPHWTGLGMASMDNIAFESAKISGIFQEMDIEEVQAISRAYSYFDSYTKFSENLMEKLLAIDSNSKVADIIVIFEVLGSDIIITEQRVKEEIDKINSQLENINK
ncbi:hypothetical protein EI546_06680 [Aequorivita sp. H23M31]|uniref:Uncharacterized protein n=1 Tax=Aequorivita ciconiae TaxID=2494375 RepID=A0A410G2C2_9FLAO|nr:hypothetical protein [Aequorivita sp. H23M31]QAA81434.1 hypothetical protein EI546_06680 [Aequorivita sp. H23M31]